MNVQAVANHLHHDPAMGTNAADRYEISQSLGIETAAWDKLRQMTECARPKEVWGNIVVDIPVKETYYRDKRLGRAMR